MSTTNASVLSRPAIRDAIEAKEVLISPFDERQLGNCSYDVRLGEWYYLEQRGIPGASIINPYDPDSVKAMWGEPLKAHVNEEHPLPGIPVGTPFIRLAPGACALCHTEEFIGGIDSTITTMMHGRSSIGRNFIQIECAGWGDIGFAQRWTMEVKNLSQHRHAILVPGRRVGQIIFFRTTGDASPYHQGGFGGKYQSSDLRGKTHEQLLEEWSPNMMLPRAYLDWELS